MSEIKVKVANGKIIAPSKNDKHPVGSLPNQKIKWKLETDGWIFPQNGIVVEGGGQQFSGFTPTHDGTGYECTDLNSNNQSYKYTITLNSTTGGSPISLDPYIENGGVGDNG